MSRKFMWHYLEHRRNMLVTIGHIIYGKVIYLIRLGASVGSLPMTKL